MQTENTGDSQRQIILVVIRDAFERNYTSMLLQRFGYHVCTVTGEKEALDFVSGASPALIIADEALACAETSDLLAHLKQNQETAGIPIIVISTVSDPGASARYREKGCCEVLGRPINSELLYRTVQNTIEEHPRQNIRISVYVKAVIENHPGGQVKFATVLSENGMFVRTTTTLPVNSRIRASLMIKNRAVKVEAVVLYSNGFDEYPRKEIGMGMRFLDIAPEDRAFIREFIQEQIERGFRQKRHSEKERKT